MPAFSPNWQWACVLVLLFGDLLASTAFDDYEYEDPDDHKEILFSASGKCVLSLTTLLYELNIDPITLPKFSHKFDDITKLSSPAWVKIKVSVNSTHCNDNDAIIIALNPHNCNINYEDVKVSQSGTGHQIQIINQMVYKKFLKPRDFSTTPYLYTIQLHDSPNNGDQLEIYIPYELKFQHGSGYDQHHGLYIFNEPRRNSTHLKSIRSSHIFPEIDQHRPEKSLFKISVARSEADGYVAISNMEIEATANVSGMEGWVRDHFKVTPPLPVEQVTVMILHGFNNYTYIHKTENSTLTDVEISIWTRNRTRDDALVSDASVEISRLLQIFGSKFSEVGYPFQKLDIVYELVYCAHYSLGIATKQPYHENLPLHIARQWIGGMSTPYTESRDRGHQVGYPDFLAKYVAEWGAKIPTDRSNSPLRNIQEDDLAFLEMFEEITSKELIEFAISKIYLPKMKWKMVPADYIYEAIQEALMISNASNSLPESVATVMELRQTWSPKRVLNKITITEAINDTSSVQIFLEQRNGDQLKPWIPLKIFIENGSDLIWVSAADQNGANATGQTFTSHSINTTYKWVIATSGYFERYHIWYNGTVLSNLIVQLRNDHTVIPWHLRKILFSTQYQHWEHWQNTKQFLEFTKYLGNETDLRVWTEAIDRYNQLYHLLEQRPLGETFSKLYFGNLTNSVLEKIGAFPGDGENQQISMLRIQILEWCSTFQGPLCLDYSKVLMTRWMTQPEINPYMSKNISGIWEKLVCAALRDSFIADDATQLFDFLFDKLTNLTYGPSGKELGPKSITKSVTVECHWMARALACSNDVTLLMKLLTMGGRDVILSDCLHILA